MYMYKAMPMCSLLYAQHLAANVDSQVQCRLVLGVRYLDALKRKHCMSIVTIDFSTAITIPLLSSVSWYQCEELLP